MLNFLESSLIIWKKVCTIHPKRNNKKTNQTVIVDMTIDTEIITGINMTEKVIKEGVMIEEITANVKNTPETVQSLGVAGVITVLGLKMNLKHLCILVVIIILYTSYYNGFFILD